MSITNPSLTELEKLQARVEALEFALTAALAAQRGQMNLQEALIVQRALISELVEDPTYLNSHEHRQLVSSQFTELMWAAWETLHPPKRTEKGKALN